MKQDNDQLELPYLRIFCTGDANVKLTTTLSNSTTCTTVQNIGMSGAVKITDKETLLITWHRTWGNELRIVITGHGNHKARTTCQYGWLKVRFHPNRFLGKNIPGTRESVHSQGELIPCGF